MALDFEVVGQRKKGRLKRLRKKEGRLLSEGMVLFADQSGVLA